MSLEWLHLRISEEKDRREREARILERLPRALEEVHASLSACVEAYAQAFGPEVAQIQVEESRIVVTVREQRQGSWEQISRVEISSPFVFCMDSEKNVFRRRVPKGV